jgi:hypothetical protein
MLVVSTKYIITAPFAVQSGRLVTCLILLLLSFPLVEQTHEDRCEQTACAVCSVLSGSLLPALEHFTVITLKPAGIVRNESAIPARMAFARLYDGRGPPQIS